MRRMLAVVATLAVAVGVLAIGSTITATAATCTGTGTVQIDSFAFNPPAVNAGQPSTLTLVATNCTGQQLQTTDIWSGRYVGPDGTTIPPGCPVIDPIAPSLTLPPNGQGTASQGFSTFAMCPAVALKSTVTISSGGVTLASQTATLTIGSTGSSGSASPPPATCTVTYARQSEWSGGFVAQITIANTGTTQVSGWTLAFAFPGDQVVGNAWNAAVSQSGKAVTATNLPYNRVIAPGASASFGFQGTWHSSDASPTAFTLNGAACTVR